MAPKPEKTQVILTSACVLTLLIACAVKKLHGSGDKSAVDFNMAAAGSLQREKYSSFVWKDKVETLIAIFSEETIQFSLEKVKCPKDRNDMYNCAMRE